MIRWMLSASNGLSRRSVSVGMAGYTFACRSTNSSKRFCAFGNADQLVSARAADAALHQKMVELSASLCKAGLRFHQMKACRAIVICRLLRRPVASLDASLDGRRKGVQRQVCCRNRCLGCAGCCLAHAATSRLRLSLEALKATLPSSRRRARAITSSFDCRVANSRSSRSTYGANCGRWCRIMTSLMRSMAASIRSAVTADGFVVCIWRDSVWAIIAE